MDELEKGEIDMKHRMDRRSFLKTAGAVGAGISLGIPGGRLARAGEGLKISSPAAEKLGWKIAAQLYTFRRFPFYEALEMIAKLGIRLVEPCFFLGLDRARPELKTGEGLSPEVRKELRGRLEKHGIRMANFYADLQNDADRCRKTFEFAREMGARTLVAEPPPEAFGMIEKLCGEFKINLAVHNHPRGSGSRYWTPDKVLEVCKGRSRRIGACCDTGHWVRSGLDPVECLKKMEGRIITMHLKDVIEWGKPEARDVPLGTGKANYGAVLKELRRQGFRGVLSIEYEHDSPKLMEEVAACVKFVEKTSRSLRA
jgi:sugar phosphate isomerase/epimerase